MLIFRLFLIVTLLALTSCRRGDSPHHLLTSPSHLSNSQDICKISCAFVYRNNTALLTACCNECQITTISSYFIPVFYLFVAMFVFLICFAIYKKCIQITPSNNTNNNNTYYNDNNYDYPVRSAPPPATAHEKLLGQIRTKAMPCLTRMSFQQFQSQKQQFQNETWRIESFGGDESDSSEVKFKLRWEDGFVCKLEGSGKGERGDWESEGVWFCGEADMRLQMVKRYEKGGDMKMVVYRGQEKTEGIWEGEWYEVDDEGNRGKSGVWKMREELFGKMNLQKRESIQIDNFR